MTTRILAPRTARLVVASLIVVLLVATKAVLMPLLALVAVALAWLVVPGDRRWFVPASLLVVVAGFFWPLYASVRYRLADGSQLMVRRLTGEVVMLPPNKVRTDRFLEWYRLHPDGWVRLTPIPRPSLLAMFGITRPSSPPRAVRISGDSIAVGFPGRPLPVDSTGIAAAVPPAPADLSLRGGCFIDNRWVPCPLPTPNQPQPQKWRAQ